MASSLETFIGKPLHAAKKIAWFGFSADPPTLAHRSIVDAVLGSGMVERIVVFPAGKLSYKEFHASDWQRRDMVELWKTAADFEDEVIISHFDLLRNKAMSWYELWKILQERSPKIQHYLVVGADQYQKIPRYWNRGNDLLNQASFIIIPRMGFDVLPSYQNHHVLPIAPLPVSIADVRKGGLSVVDERVKAYMLEQGLS